MKMDFTKEAVKELSADIAEALKAVAEKHGVTVKVGGGRYDPVSGTFQPKVEFAADDRGEREFRAHAHLFGLSPSDHGRTFVSGGKTYRVVGFNLKARKRPIIVAEVGTTGQFVFTEEAVLRALGIPTREERWNAEAAKRQAEKPA